MFPVIAVIECLFSILSSVTITAVCLSDYFHRMVSAAVRCNILILALVNSLYIARLEKTKNIYSSCLQNRNLMEKVRKIQFEIWNFYLSYAKIHLLLMSSLVEFFSPAFILANYTHLQLEVSLLVWKKSRYETLFQLNVWCTYIFFCVFIFVIFVCNKICPWLWVHMWLYVFMSNRL